MNIKLEKINKLVGNIVARPSKSFAHRYLIASALSESESTISNIDFSDDIIATLNCIHAYGKKHYRDFDKREVRFFKESTKNFDPTFDCNESGTTLRMFMPVALSKYNKATFIGSERLIERGIGIYEEILKYIIWDKDKYSIKTKGTINSGEYNIPGNISSQYISGLLYTLPLLDGDSKINITTEIESANYILMTLDVLKNYGIKIETNLVAKPASVGAKPTSVGVQPASVGAKPASVGAKPTSVGAQACQAHIVGAKHCEPVYFYIKGNQNYTPHNFSIEGDYSNIAFIDAFNYFGNDIKITGLNTNSLQSDIVYKKYFDMLHKDFHEINISNCIDLGPVLITFAAMKHGAKFTGTSRLKIKESDRGNAIASELKKCGADIKIYENDIVVNKKELQKPATPLSSHNDHRIAMSLSLLSNLFAIEIENSECVSKSYPSYFDDLKSLGV